MKSPRRGFSKIQFAPNAATVILAVQNNKSCDISEGTAEGREELRRKSCYAHNVETHAGVGMCILNSRIIRTVTIDVEARTS